MNVKCRIQWIDVCKSIAMILVIWLHFGAPYVGSYIHLFHMPVFFFLSGFCFDEKKLTTLTAFAQKRLKSLLVPYLSFAVIMYLFWQEVYIIFNMETVPVALFLRSVLWTNTTSVPKLWGGVQWFLTALFIVEFLYYLIHRLLNNKHLVFVLSISISFVMILLSHYFSIPRLPLAIDSAIVALMFYATGNLLRDHFYFRTEYSKRYAIMLFVAALVVSIILFIIIGGTNIRTMQFGKHPVLYYLGAIAGCIMLCSFSILSTSFRIPSIVDKWFKNFGRNTIIVLYSHRWFDGINKTVLSLIGIQLSGVIKYIYFGISLLFFLAIANSISDIVCKYAYFLIGREKSN